MKLKEAKNNELTLYSFDVGIKEGREIILNFIKLSLCARKWETFPVSLNNKNINMDSTLHLLSRSTSTFLEPWQLYSLKLTLHNLFSGWWQPGKKKSNTQLNPLDFQYYYQEKIFFNTALIWCDDGAYQTQWKKMCRSIKAQWVKLITYLLQDRE